MPVLFAIPQDLADLMQRALDDDFIAYATLLLANASAILRATYPWLDSRIAADTFDADLAKQAVTGMAKRAMLGPAAGEKSAGLGEVSVTYDNPMGNLYLTQVERDLITGPARPSVGTARLVSGWTVPCRDWL